MQEEKSDCKKYIELAKKANGWFFASIMIILFGEMTVILRCKNGKEFSFAATKEWIEANDFKALCKSIDFDDDEHIANCQSPECMEVTGRTYSITPYLNNRKILPKMLLEFAEKQSKKRGDVCILEEKTVGTVGVLSVLLFFKWLESDRNLFIWPEEKAEVKS